LKYARENGCPWNEATCSKAALRAAKSRRHRDCLKYAHDNGCPGSESYAHHLQ
jgi:hypothetical protein